MNYSYLNKIAFMAFVALFSMKIAANEEASVSPNTITAHLMKTFRESHTECSKRGAEMQCHSESGEGGDSSFKSWQLIVHPHSVELCSKFTAFGKEEMTKLDQEIQDMKEKRLAYLKAQSQDKYVFSHTEKDSLTDEFTVKGSCTLSADSDYQNLRKECKFFTIFKDNPEFLKYMFQ